MAEHHKTVDVVKQVMQNYIELHPNQQRYTFAFDDPADASIARQAGVEVAASLAVPIVVFVGEEGKPHGRK